MSTPLYTLLALLAFAGNSVLCRLALSDNIIDGASFTAVRLISGIVVLSLIFLISNTDKKYDNTAKGSWKSSLLLFIYAVTFSFAYNSLDTGVGALVLFASVQITMILTSLFTGNKLTIFDALGVTLAGFGFLYLVMPNLTTPSLLGFILMAISGIAWGLYTLAGKGSNNPLADTTYNFLRTLPFIILLIALCYPNLHLSQQGILLAVLSGGLASGLGYTIWYSALTGLSSIQAAVVQLLVPIIAAMGGIFFAEEPLSLRLVIASIMVLGGIFIVVIHGYIQNKT